jgi:copper resistance protein B
LPEGADPHARHGMSANDAPADPPMAPPPPEAFSGPAHAADLFWDSQAMQRSRREMRREHGGLAAYRVLVDQLEARLGDGADSLHLEADAWFGGDIDKIWFKAEGEGDSGNPLQEAELQALWSHAIDPWFDLQAGVRYDSRPGSDRAYLVAGIQGLAPYWIEIDAAAFVSDKGDVTARLEAEHDVRITQQLILQPRVELDFALQDVPEAAIGAGLSTASLGARLRYQLRPEFAPYAGVHYSRAFADSRDYRRLAGEDLGGFSVVVGLRTWF